MVQQVIGQHIVSLLSVGSTNAYARNVMDEQAVPEGTVIIAAEQHRGKGYGQNVWISKKGKNLTFSLIVHPGFLTADNQFLISKAISLGICDYLLEHTTDVSIKWPNDIYIGDRKICGILIENDLVGRIMKHSIVGIGLNINQEIFPRRLPNPVSLAQITGVKYDLKTEFHRLLHHLNNRYLMLKTSAKHKIHRDYQSRLYRLGDLYFFRAHEQTFQARIVGVNDYGQLITENECGKTTEYNFKEVEFVL